MTNVCVLMTDLYYVTCTTPNTESHFRGVNSSIKSAGKHVAGYFLLISKSCKMQIRFFLVSWLKKLHSFIFKTLKSLFKKKKLLINCIKIT